MKFMRNRVAFSPGAFPGPPLISSPGPQSWVGFIEQMCNSNEFHTRKLVTNSKLKTTMKKQLLSALFPLLLALASGTSVLASLVLDSVTLSSQSPASILSGGTATYTVTVYRTGTGNIDIYLS